MPSSSPITLETAQQIVNIGGVLAAGIGAYIRFFKGRIFYTRLAPDLETTVIKSEDVSYLSVKMSVKNIGTTNASLRENGQILIIKRCKKVSDPQFLAQSHWEDERVFLVFLEEQNLEPDEVILQERTFSLPRDNFLALNVCLEISARKALWPAFIWVVLKWKKASRKFLVFSLKVLRRFKIQLFRNSLWERLKKLKAQKTGNHIWRSQKVIFLHDLVP